MIVSQQNNGNQNSSTGKLMFCGHAQTNGPFLYGDTEQAYGKKGLVFHTHSTANELHNTTCRDSKNYLSR